MGAGDDPREAPPGGGPARDPIARLVHDLRSPLAVAEGFATLLARDDGDLSLEQRKDFASRIADSAADMRRLLDEAG